MNKIHVDIMTGGGDRYYDTFTFLHDPIFGNFHDELREAFTTRYPTLRHRKDIVLCMDDSSA